MRDLAQVEIASRAELRDWLAAHHEQDESIWLVAGKKTAGERYLPSDAVAEEVLCFGWIDSRVRALDDKRMMRLLSPRRPKSDWSPANRERVARLTTSGQMHPAGLAKVEAAKADGSWDRANPVGSEAMPAALVTLLETDSAARGLFDALSPAKRKLAISWIANAKSEGTRARRIEALIIGLQRGLDPIQWRASLAP